MRSWGIHLKIFLQVGASRGRALFTFVLSEEGGFDSKVLIPI